MIVICYHTIPSQGIALVRNAEIKKCSLPLEFAQVGDCFLVEKEGDLVHYKGKARILESERMRLQRMYVGV